MSGQSPGPPSRRAPAAAFKQLQPMPVINSQIAGTSTGSNSHNAVKFEPIYSTPSSAATSQNAVKFEPVYSARRQAPDVAPGYGTWSRGQKANKEPDIVRSDYGTLRRSKIGQSEAVSSANDYAQRTPPEHGNGNSDTLRSYASSSYDTLGRTKPHFTNTNISTASKYWSMPNNNGQQQHQVSSTSPTDNTLRRQRRQWTETYLDDDPAPPATPLVPPPSTSTSVKQPPVSVRCRIAHVAEPTEVTRVMAKPVIPVAPNNTAVTASPFSSANTASRNAAASASIARAVLRGAPEVATVAPVVAVTATRSRVYEAAPIATSKRAEQSDNVHASRIRVGDAPTMKPMKEPCDVPSSSTPASRVASVAPSWSTRRPFTTSTNTSIKKSTEHDNNTSEPRGQGHLPRCKVPPFNGIQATAPLGTSTSVPSTSASDTASCSSSSAVPVSRKSTGKPHSSSIVSSCDSGIGTAKETAKPGKMPAGNAGIYAQLTAADGSRSAGSVIAKFLPAIDADDSGVDDLQTEQQ